MELGFEILFGQGLDTKTDPFQVPAGKLLSLENAVFRNNFLQKRNGFGNLTVLPNTLQTNITTCNGTLVATGSNLLAYTPESNSWLNRGIIQPVHLSVLALARGAQSISQVDAVVEPGGLCCTAFTMNSVPYYVISDSVTGQAVTSFVALPTTAKNIRVCILGRYFIVVFGATVAGTPHLQYVAIPISQPNSPLAANDLTTSISAITAAFDITVANNIMYYSWNASDGGGAIRTSTLTSTLVNNLSPVVIAGKTATIINLTTDTSGNTPTLWLSFWAANDGYAAAYDFSLAVILAATATIAATAITELAGIAKNGTLTFFFEVSNTYAFSPNAKTDYVKKNTITTAGTVGTASTVCRGIGIASRPFFYNDVIYILCTYGQTYQPTYFLFDSSGNALMKLAYSNGIGYISGNVLPTVSINNDIIQIPYLIKDQLTSVNKSQGVANVNGIYAQAGVNLASITINNGGQYSSEIASALHLTGGFVWEYDSIKPVEHSFHVWPEDVQITTSGAGGLITAQQYFYVFTYEWTDGRGQLHRSAPSVPFSITTTGATSTNTCSVPTLRITYKTGQNLVRIVGYRWSVAQQNYYQFTSVSAPTLNDTTVDYVTITDTSADSAILGNELLYTTGGVIENIAAPAVAVSALFGSRLWVVDSENRNLLWYSKQVIEQTPVEFSDLLTLFVPPTTGAQGSTGAITALSAMDDKLIIFKKDAMYYVVGRGPDNTGANNDFSDAIYISATVGCERPSSIVQVPIGLMFQSDKGIWLLGRDLSTTYIGADVQAYNDTLVVSALTIPGTNEVRFTLEDGTILMYDYYEQQWGTHSNIPAVASCLYNGLHTYLNDLGQIRQETPDLYLDGSAPVLIKATTAWLRLNKLQGYQRALFFYLLGVYISPHKINLSVAYDWQSSSSHSYLFTPTNVSSTWGGEALWGSGDVWGGSGNVEQERIFLEQQRCQSIQITLQELYDPSQGIAAGAGFTMSGINLVARVKQSFPVIPSSQSTG